MTKWKRDIVCAACLFVFIVANFIYSYVGISKSLVRETLAHPGVYLRLWLVVLALLTAAMALRAYKGRREEEGRPLPIFSKIAVFTAAAFFVYLLILPHLGFFISTMCFLMAIVPAYSLKMLPERPGGKQLAINIVKWLAFSLCLTLATDVIFREGLSVLLPEFTLFS